MWSHKRLILNICLTGFMVLLCVVAISPAVALWPVRCDSDIVVAPSIEIEHDEVCCYTVGTVFDPDSSEGKLTVRARDFDNICNGVPCDQGLTGSALAGLKPAKWSGDLGTSETGWSDPDDPGWRATSLQLPTFNKAGTYTVTVTVDDVDCPYADDVPVSVTFVISVKPKAPECPMGGIANVGCDTAPGSGCSSCNGGGDSGFPWPGLRLPNVEPIFWAPSGLGGPGIDGANTGSKSCGNNGPPTIEEVETCGASCSPDTYYLYKSSCCCQVFHVGDPTIAGEQTDSARDGAVIVRTPYTSGGASYQIKYPDGSTNNYSFDQRPSSDTWTQEKGPDAIHNPDGSTMTFGRNLNGALNTVTMPNGDVWTYEHETNGTKVTGVTAPDGKHVVITYIQSGNAKDKISTISVYSSSTETYQMDYVYNNDGMLWKAIKENSKQVWYDYLTADRIEVTERDSTGSIVIARTVFDYSDTIIGNATIKTTKIIKDSTPSTPEVATDDPTSTYTFKTGNYEGKTYKTDISSVTDPLGMVVSTTYITGTNKVSDTCIPFTKDSGGNTLYTTTHYEYMPNTDFVSSVKTTSYTKRNGAWVEVIRTETTDYYTDPVVPSQYTSWVKEQVDARGTHTYYVRDLNNLWKLTAVKVSNTSHTDEEWASDNTIPAIKQYEYYESDDPNNPDYSNGHRGQLKKEIVPDIEGTSDQETEYRYAEPSGKLRNSPTQIFYDDATGIAQHTTTVYDNMERVQSTTDADGRTICYRYDDHGRLTHTIYKWIDANNNQFADIGETLQVYTENTYRTCCDLLEYSSDENGNYTYYDYDNANRLWKTWTGIQYQNGTTPLVQYVYDDLGRKQHVITRSDVNTTRTTTYTYDNKLNRVKTISYPDGLIGTEEFWYDDAGNVRCKRDGNGSITGYLYDGFGRLLNVYYNYTGSLTEAIPLNYVAQPVDVTYDYTEDGIDYGASLKTSMVDSSGNSSYNYDIQGRLLDYTPPKPSGHTAVTYTYNNLGQKISITSGSYSVSYDYYANGWLKDVKSGNTTLASYSYGPAGNRLMTILGNGTSTVYSYEDYDPMYKLNSITQKQGTTTLAEISYPTRDNAGSPISMTDWNGTWSYGYDENNRLTSATPPSPITDQPVGGNYGYDWVGNRLNPPSGDNHMVYDKADRVISWPGMRNYSYYGDGSLNEERNAQGTLILSYTYHLNGLLNQAKYVTPTGNRIATNIWDTNGNRVGLQIHNETYEFVYDVITSVPAVIEEKLGTNTVYYYRDPNGSLIARYDQSSDNKWRYYHFDALGSTRLLTTAPKEDGSVDVTDKYSYDAWGKMISHEKLMGSVDQPYQFIGEQGYYTHYQDTDYKLLQLGVRLYDTEVGRFTQRDSIVDDTTTLYTYVGDSPTEWIDDSGRNKKKPSPKKNFPDIDSSWKTCIENALKKYGANKNVTPKMIRCMIYAESTDNPNEVRGSNGATGLMQLMPEWWKPGAKGYKVHCRNKNRCQDVVGSSFSPTNPCDNITCGIYLFVKVHNSNLDEYGTTHSPSYNKCMAEYKW